MEILIGFIIALSVGLTGIGGGSFTTPALVLISGIPGAEAVGTALIFSTVVRLAAAPFYLVARQIHFRYLSLMLLGAIPGLLAGTYVLLTMNTRNIVPFVLVIIGLMLVVSSILSFQRRRGKIENRPDSASWLPWLTLPIGLETGFSSAGSGALGTLLLLNFSNMQPSQVVGTDLIFGILIAGVGAIFHFSFGAINAPALKHLLIGGVPGVLAGCALAPRVSGRKLRPMIAVIALLIGFQIVWSGLRLWLSPPASVRTTIQPIVSSRKGQ